MINMRATWHAMLGVGCLGVALMAPSPARLPGLKAVDDVSATASIPQQAPAPFTALEIPIDVCLEKVLMPLPSRGVSLGV